MPIFSSFASEYGPPKPPKKLRGLTNEQVSLTWERDQENLNQGLHYLIYQKFYSSYNEYEGYNGYQRYFSDVSGKIVPKIRSPRDLISNVRPRAPEQFSQAQYSDMPGLRRSKLINQYRLIDGFLVEGSSGTGSHYVNYGSYDSYGNYGGYSSYFAFHGYWTYNENEVNYEITGSLPEKTDFDERRRGRGYSPVFKVVAAKANWWQRSLASAESSPPLPYNPPPAPEDVTVRLLDSGNVHLEWDSGFGSSWGDYYHRIYQNVYDPYGAYQTYQPYRSYSNFVELATVRSNTGGRLSYEVPASRVRTGAYEYASTPATNPLGIYKVVSGYVSGGIRDSQASPESWFADPLLTLSGGNEYSVCVGQEISFLVEARNAFNQRPTYFDAFDVGGNGVDVNVFLTSSQNQSPASFDRQGSQGVFRWTPSHAVDTEIVRFLANDSYTVSYERTQVDVTIETRTC